MRCHSFDAVKHLVLCRMEGRPQRLDLELYRSLPRIAVTKTATTWRSCRVSGGERESDGAVGAPPQGTEAADLPESVKGGVIVVA